MTTSAREPGNRRKASAALVMVTAMAAWVVGASARGGERGEVAARVNNLKVLTDKVDDVTTVEAILGSFVRPGMSDEERARALWTAVVKYRHQAPPPHEDLAADWEAHDPVKILNVYGYCMCCCTSALIAALNRADGRDARGRILNGHSVPEVRYGDAWHMFDPALITYFPGPDGAAASVDEIAGAVRRWYDGHPGYRGDREKLLDLMRGDGWTGWKARGPELLAACPFYRGGYFPAGTHGWSDTMAEYDRRPSEVYEYGYQVGHRALFGLRPGESLTREAGNRGLYVDGARAPGWKGLSARAPEGDLAYLKEFFPGYRGGVVGNGVHRYAPDLASSDLAAGAETFENLATGTASPMLRPAEAGRPGVAVVALESPYVYLGGRVTIKGVRKTEADRVTVSLSTNQGRSYSPIWSAAPTGAQEATVDLGERVLRRYACRVKVEILAATPGGAGLDALAVENDVQHAPRTLPRIGRGTNEVTVSADGDPAVATRTVSCRITPDASFRRNETTGTMGVTFENLDVKDGSCWWKSGVGTMTVPIDLPGDLVSLRASAHVRARGAKDAVTLRASVDGGRTWRDAGAIHGPTPATTRAFAVSDWPAGVRSVLLRFELTGNNTIGVFSFRADADYRDPLASGRARPFRVVHRWTEAGAPRQHVETVAALPHRYTIAAAGEPEMVSVTYEMPAGR